MIWVVGAGICQGQITERGRELLRRADVVYGSRRAFELMNVEVKEKRILTRFDDSVFEEIAREGAGKEVVVLSTGDPMVAGLGRRIRGIDAEVEIEPGISSVQLALAKLKVDLTEVVVVDCHARDFDSSLLDFLRYRHLLILADRRFDLTKLGKRRVVILENLCMENEMVREDFADSAEIKSDYTIIFLEKEVVE
ncbi:MULTISPECIES: cobalt-precorrin-7 (C(5))-methyltransferase [unclassified Archaeoglobus]|jgi:cobalt-precorrin-7 (C5)-methyltransferase|uniref:cobalt-precorrin-7 (C(5))-methyltransferase n=1 Tax=unclassified Archaeoglobus TaxID=2643606 RepID=UPI0025BCC308|nr:MULTISPECIES: cobalt-precorrin-7 (C(5))-methyltransferase [unclassified Archaeoglobus]